MSDKNFLRFVVFLSVVGVSSLFFFKEATDKVNDALEETKENKIYVAANDIPNPDIELPKINKKRRIYQLNPNENRTLFLFGEVNSGAVFLAEQIKQLSSSSSEPIYLLINSPGGSVLDGALVVSAIEGSTAPVYTVCLQVCASMAAIIHQYGTERLMTDRSILMFHNAAGGARGYLPQMLSRLNVINKYVNKMNAYIASRAKINLSDYLAKMGDELWMDAEDATNSRFNDRVVNVVIPIGNSEAQNEATEKLKSVIDIKW